LQNFVEVNLVDMLVGAVAADFDHGCHRNLVTFLD
jgi:hypothetical protein